MNDKNEIKKAIYKDKPPAIFLKIQSGHAYYSATLKNEKIVMFDIPVSDMGNASFESVMDAKLLNRWIDKISN